MPPTPFHPATITKRVFRKLTKAESTSFTAKLRELSKWCFSFIPSINDASLSMVQKYSDTLSREISSYYHQITSLCTKPDSKIIKTIRQALSDVPSPTHPLFSAKMAHVNDKIHHP